MAERRIDATDIAVFMEVAGHIDVALYALSSVDLRHYAGDEEVRVAVKNVRRGLADNRKALMHLRKVEMG